MMKSEQAQLGEERMRFWLVCMRALSVFAPFFL